MKLRSILNIDPSTDPSLRSGLWLRTSPSTLLRTSLLAVLWLVACAPATPAPTAPPEMTIQPALPESVSTVPPTVVQPQASETEAQPTQAPTQAPTEAPQAVATSRGPDLEATDPATVSLASGDLQLVEFFRFT